MLETLLEYTPLKAFGYGVLSAASLPLGAALGIWLKPRARVMSAIMSFGAGSLLAALTLELVSPALTKTGFLPLASGLVLGGALFVVFNQLLCQKGGFLRKPATMLRHRVRSERDKRMSRLRHLAAIDLMENVPPEALPEILDMIHRRYVDKGQILYKQGDHADSFIMLDNGEVEGQRDGEPPFIVCQGNSLGTRSFLSEAKIRGSTYTALTDVKVWEVFPDDWRAMTTRYPVIAENMARVNESKEHACQMRREAWSTVKDLDVNLGEQFHVSLKPIAQSETNLSPHAAALAIWLGIFLDGIPESAVIGASMTHAAVSWALIIGLFLANLPESMSSAAAMRQNKASISFIMWMWTSLTVMTGVGALLGNVFMEHASPVTHAVFEGTAAGAMLVMVAETMLPEAYHHGGPVVGVCTLLGFLTAILVKSVT